MKEKQQGLFIGIVLALICFCAIGATVYKTVVGTGSPVNNSIVVWDGVNGNKVRYSAITINSSNDLDGINILYVDAFVPADPLTQPYGGTGGTNPETAQVALMLRPGLDIQTQNSSLQMIATIPLSTGTFIYYDGSNLTNIASTSTGRSLLIAADAATALNVVGGVAKAGDTMTGNLFVPYVAYDASMTNGAYAGLILSAKAIAEKIESLIIGAFISSVDEADLEVDETGKLYITNSVGSGPLVRESTLGGTNGTLASLLDVDISNPSDGQSLRYNSISSNWVNTYNRSLSDFQEEESVLTPIIGSAISALTPFSTFSFGGGSGSVSSFYNGRVGVWLATGFLSANVWAGSSLYLGTTSALALTNKYAFECEFLLVATNGINNRIGFYDGASSNAPTDALYFNITNGVSNLEGMAGGFTTVGTTPLVLETNIWYRLILKGTNTVAIANVYQAGTSIWNDSISGTNIPSAAASQILGAGATAFSTASTGTNTPIMYINQIGFKYQNVN